MIIVFTTFKKLLISYLYLTLEVLLSLIFRNGEKDFVPHSIQHGKNHTLEPDKLARMAATVSGNQKDAEMRLPPRDEPGRSTYRNAGNTRPEQIRSSSLDLCL